MSPTATLDHSPVPAVTMGASAGRPAIPEKASTAVRASRSNLRACSELNREWEVALDSAANDAVVAEWGCRKLSHTRAAGVRMLRELEGVCHSVQGEDKDAVLLALLGLHQAGVHLAGRLLLQLFLGKIVVLATPRGSQGVSVHEHEANALAAFWTVISTYPCDRRRRRVGANLAMDTLNGVYGRAVTKERPQAVFQLSEQSLNARTVKPRQDPTAAVLLLIHDGVAAQAISLDEAQLLTATYAPAAAPVTSAQLAEQFNLSAPTLRQRRSRAVSRLGAYVRGEVLTNARRLSSHGDEGQHMLPIWVKDQDLLVLMNALAPCAG